MDEIQIDYFKVKDFVNGNPIKQDEVIDIIKSNRFKKITDICRGELSGSINKDKRRVFKTKNLPLVTFGGIFNRPRSKKTLKQHSGQASIDFDEYNKEKSDILFKKLKKDEYIHILFKSPSYGLKAIIKIPLCKTDEEYKKYFYGILKYYNKHSPTQDTGCADVSRLCFLSYDPFVYINEESKIFTQQGEKTIKIFEQKEDEVIPEYCPFIENIAAKHQLPSGEKTRHTYLDGNVWRYTRKNNKRKVLEGYMTAQGRTLAAFNDSESYCFSCGTIRKYLRGNKDKSGFVKEGLKICDECPEYKKFIENSTEIVLPGRGRLISNFAGRLGNIFNNKSTLFYKPQENNIVEIVKIKEGEEEEEFLGFHILDANRLITCIERYITPGIYVRDIETKEIDFHPKSMGNNVGNVVLESHNFREKLPIIKRIFTVPIPILYKGNLSFPKKGYDKRFYSWLPYNSPTISEPEMKLEEAKKLLTMIYKEFPFQDHQDYINAIAGLISPFLRGLYSNFNVRSPVFFYVANRERAGKDYCAGITGMLYEGCALEEPPISTSGNKRANNEEELRKKLLSAFISGRKRLHFANNKGFINNSTFEQVATATVYSDRLLGKNDVINVDNEIDFSLSGNIGVSYTPDFASRCRFIRLMLDVEDANKRKFKNPSLHFWVLKNRDKVLSAIYSLVKNWIDRGMVKGTKLFTSFPEWAKICGGVMEAAGFDNPCESYDMMFNIGGDVESDNMKMLYEFMYKNRAEESMTKSEIRNFVFDENELNLFPYLDITTRSGQTIFGMIIDKFVNRIMSDIRLVCDNNERSARRRYRFTKEKREIDEKKIFGNDINNVNIDDYLEKDEVVTLVTLGNVSAPTETKKYINNNRKGSMQMVPQVTRLPLPVHQKTKTIYKKQHYIEKSEIFDLQKHKKEIIKIIKELAKSNDSDNAETIIVVKIIKERTNLSEKKINELIDEMKWKSNEIMEIRSGFLTIL